VGDSWSVAATNRRIALPPIALARSLRAHVAAIAAYAAVGLLFVWPLPLHLGSHLTGSPTGDTGVYVWNLWVFQYEVLTHHQLPFFTSTILSLGGRADLTLHNYTVFADLLALPLVRPLGLVAAFNVVYIALTVLTAYGGFLLARSVAGRNAEAWLAGLVFAWSPALVARGSAHFSLVAAAPLPVFVLMMLGAERTGRRRYAVGAGLAVAWAAYCDPYYAVYCVLLACLHAIARAVSWTRLRDEPSSAILRARRLANGALLLCAAVAGGILATGGGAASIGGVAVSMTSLYTPVLLLTVFATVRAWLAWPLVPSLRVPQGLARLARLTPYGALAGIVALSPFLVAVALRIADGRFVAPRIFWRTSTPGVDLLAFVLPNPNHPLAPGAIHGWLSSLNGGFVENVASLPWLVLAVIVIAALSLRAAPSGYWLGLSLVTASLALGPFIHLAGICTYVPTPWTLLRYVPIIDTARAPARFTAVVMMGLAMLFALALTALGRANPRWRPGLLGVVAVLAMAELWPAPRQLFAAGVPAIYDRIAADPAAVRVLELPFGVRDGLSSLGDFNASSQFYQARHGKQLLGGYLSRLSTRRIQDTLRRPILRTLAFLSERQPVPPELAEAAARSGRQFVTNARIGYVVVDRSRASPELEAFAARVLDLEKIDQSAQRVLYRPRVAAGLGTVGAMAYSGQ
jgi:hypothetical protein